MFMFFSFSGRLNRQPFLILSFALLGIYVFSVAVFIGGLGGVADNIVISGLSGSLQAIRSMNSGLLTLMSVMSLTLVLVTLISSVSLCVRRLHDRDKSGWWLLIYYLANLVLIIIGMYLVSIDKPTAYFIVITIQCAVTLWLFFELCFLRGSNGPNLYGSDPLNGSAADSAIFG